MNLFELTRALVDIESITENEERVGEFLFDASFGLASRVLAGTSSAWRWSRTASTCWRSGAMPVVTLSTHMDTVPPFFASREDDEFIWGRAACDTKGIIASMIQAAEALLEAGRPQFRAAVRGGRGAQQRGRLSRGAASHAARNF